MRFLQQRPRRRCRNPSPVAVRPGVGSQQVHQVRPPQLNRRRYGAVHVHHPPADGQDAAARASWVGRSSPRGRLRLGRARRAPCLAPIEAHALTRVRLDVVRRRPHHRRAIVELTGWRPSERRVHRRHQLRSRWRGWSRSSGRAAALALAAVITAAACGSTAAVGGSLVRTRAIDLDGASLLGCGLGRAGTVLSSGASGAGLQSSGGMSL